MLAVTYVVVTAALVALWIFASSRFPRIGLVANGAAVVFLVPHVLRWSHGIEARLGWTILGFITAGFGALAAVAGLIEARGRAVERDVIPWAAVEGRWRAD